MLSIKNDQKALNISGHLFLFFMKKAVIGFLQPIKKKKEKQDAFHKV